MRRLTYKQLLKQLRKKSKGKFEKLIEAEKLLEIDKTESFVNRTNISHHSKIMDEWLFSHTQYVDLLNYTKKQGIDLDQKISE